MPEPQPPTAIEELARDMLAGSVVDWFWLVSTGNAGLIATVFGPVLWDGLLGEAAMEQIAQLVVFAVIGKNRSMGGYHVNNIPMFATCNIWLLADYDRAIELYQRAKAAVDAAFAQGEDQSA